MTASAPVPHPGLVLLQAMMRDMHSDTVRTYRCFAAFAALEGPAAGGVVALDLTPARFAALEAIPLSSEAALGFALTCSVCQPTG